MGDILIHSGDFTHRGKPEEIQKFVSFLSRQPHPHKIVVCGNHEYGLDQLEHAHLLAVLGEGVTILQDTAVTINGIKFWGSSWNNSSQAWGVSSSFRETKWELIPTDTDVLITHNPPYGILDLAWERTPHSAETCPQCGKSHPQFSHWGDKALAAAIVSRQIPLHLFGHVHDEVGIRLIGDTTYSNASMDIAKTVNVIQLLTLPTSPPTLHPSPPLPTEEWPLTKLLSRLEGTVPAAPRLPRAVLLMTGSLNPIHSGHLQNMELAKAAMESRGFLVLGGFLSPSSDLYVSSKMRSKHSKLLASTRQSMASPSLHTFSSSAAHRLRMTQLACVPSDWLAEASWEANQSSFHDFPEVLEVLDTMLWEVGLFDQPGDGVVYVCGSDHFRNCSLQRGVPTRSGPSRPVVVCTRQNDDVETLTRRPVDSALVTILSAPETGEIGTDDLSSTLVRSLLYGASEMSSSSPHLRALLPPLVFDYLISGDGQRLYREECSSAL
jgi:Icc-related predicted phosphoesterase/nicotinic acid mononucleotide adenylyltransferase